jgi:hypothetical protein
MNVVDLRAAGSVWQSSVKSFITPATVRGVTGAIAATEAVALTIPPVRAAKMTYLIASVLGSAALTYASYKLSDYLATKNFMADSNGNMLYKSAAPCTVLNPSDILSGSYTGYLTGQPNYPYYIIYIGVYPDADSALTAGIAAMTAYTGSYTYGTVTNGLVSSSCVPQTQMWNTTYLTGWYVHHSSPVNGAFHDIMVAYPKTGYASRYTNNYVATIPTTAQKTTVISAIQTDLNNGTTASIAAAQQALNEIEVALNKINTAIAQQTAVLTEIKTELDATIPSGTSTELDNKIAGETAQKDYVAAEMAKSSTATATATNSGGLTQEEVQAAVKAAIDDDTGVTEPSEPTITNPEKLSLTTVLQSFWDSITSMPIIATLQGITINCSGTSLLCLNLPSAYGGTKCWDAANIQSELNMAGTAILSIVTVLSFIGIFRG